MNPHREEQFPPGKSFVESGSPTRPPNLNLVNCGCPMACSNEVDSEAHGNGGGTGEGGARLAFITMNRQAHTFLSLGPQHPVRDTRQESSPRPDVSFGPTQSAIDILNVWLIDQAITNSPFDIDQFYPTSSSAWAGSQVEKYPQRATSPADSIEVTGYGSRPQSFDEQHPPYQLRRLSMVRASGKLDRVDAA